MRVGGYHHNPSMTYGASHRGKAAAGNRSKEADAAADAEHASEAKTDVVEEKKDAATPTSTEAGKAEAEDTIENGNSTEESDDAAEATVDSEDADNAAGDVEEAEGVEDAEKADAAAAAEEAKKKLTAFKKEFAGFLDSLVMAPGLTKAAINVAISDAAFEKMLADPEYRKEIEGKFRNEFMNLNWLSASPTYLHINVGDSGQFTATPYIDSYGKNFATESKASFWSKNANTEKTDDPLELDDTQKLFELLRSQTREEKMLFKQQLLDSYRVSMLSFMNWNQSGDAAAGSFSSLI